MSVLKPFLQPTGFEPATPLPEMRQPPPDHRLDPDDLPDLPLVLLGQVVDVVVLQEHLGAAESIPVHLKPEVIKIIQSQKAV